MNALGVVRQHRFRAMGTDVVLIGGGEPTAFGKASRRVQAIFEDDDRRFSRFRPDSELSAVNAGAGGWVPMTADFGRLLRFALDGARRSGGLFDPTVLEAIVAAGYDRDFADVVARPPEAVVPSPRRRPDWRLVEVRGRLVRLPEGVGLDFGGVAKGWAVDRAARAVRSLLPWALVNAGGDLLLVGWPPQRWLDVGLEDPLDHEAEAARVRLEAGAVATSSVTARVWGPGVHQLIDPRTSLPAATKVLQATMWAETCAEAEIRSKWALFAGPPALDRFPGVLVLTGDRILTNMVVQEAA